MRRFESHPARPRPSSLGHLALAALAATAAGCSHDDWHDECGSCGPPPPEVYQELEPNDSPFQPDRIGVVDAYTFLYVDGYVQAVGLDIVDHIEFLSATPATYDFRVDALSPGGDVDVTIYDPLAGMVVGVYAFSGPTEAGRITVHQPNRPFQIIIEAYAFDTAWSLELSGGYYTGTGALTGGAGDEPGAGAAVTFEPYDARKPQDASGELGVRVSPIEATLIPVAARE